MSSGSTGEAGIVFDQVVKTFGQSRVLAGVSFAAPAGQITAFLGPNGAGKTTALRVAAGLSRADSGGVTFDGKPLGEYRYPSRLVGFALDANSYHPGRTTRETVRLAAMAAHVPVSGVPAALERVGLGSVGRRRVGQLSLGMRQRLAIACATIASPPMLVLDEPLNGLDIEGVLWVRALLASLRAEGGTILLSSHLLREVEAVADEVVFIDRGRIVDRAEGQAETAGPRTHVVAVDAAQAASALAACGLAAQPAAEAGLIVDGDPASVSGCLVSHNIVVTHLSLYSGPGLEEEFLALTSGEFRAT